MGFSRRGPVTRTNSIFHKDGYVTCPFSTNSWTDDEYFTIDSKQFYLVEGRCWRVHNDQATRGRVHLNIRTELRSQDNGIYTQVAHGRTALLHILLFYAETVAVGLTTDHLLHFTDNRKSSVDFIPQPENTGRGAALFHKGRKNRIGVIDVAI